METQKKEVKFTPIRSKPKRKEAKEKPIVDQRDMTAFAQIIISAFITYLIIDKGLFKGTNIQLYLAVSFMIFVFTLVQHLISKRLVRWAKGKATHKGVTRKTLRKNYSRRNTKNQYEERINMSK